MRSVASVIDLPPRFKAVPAVIRCACGLWLPVFESNQEPEMRVGESRRVWCVGCASWRIVTRDD